MSTHIYFLDTHERYTRSFCGYTCYEYTIHSLETHAINTHIHCLDPHSFSRGHMSCIHIYSLVTREMHTHMHSLEKHAMKTYIHSLETLVTKNHLLIL